jgi:hypothetical protein
MWGFFKPLVTLSYWFNLQSVPLSLPFSWLVPLFMAVVLVGGIAVYVLARPAKLEKDQRRYRRRLGNAMCWAGVVGLMLCGLTWLRVPLFGMRFFFLVWLIGFGWWLIHLLRYRFKIMPAERAVQAAREAYEKWLPKPKKK